MVSKLRSVGWKMPYSGDVGKNVLMVLLFVQESHQRQGLTHLQYALHLLSLILEPLTHGQEMPRGLGITTFEAPWCIDCINVVEKVGQPCMPRTKLCQEVIPTLAQLGI